MPLLNIFYHSQYKALPAPFKPFNDCLLSLKGGANFEDETASETEKRLKRRKNSTMHPQPYNDAPSRKRLEISISP